jgi:hypothetical protein
MTPKTGLLNKCSCLAAALGVTKFPTITIIIWSYFVVLPSLTYMYNKHTLEVGSLYKSSCLAAALSVTKFTTITIMNWSYFAVLLKSDLGSTSALL